MELPRVAVNGKTCAFTVRCCDGFVQRLRGRYGASALELQCAWRLSPCNAVHTLLLTGPIDVVFCDRHDRVLRIEAPLRRNRFARHSSAHCVWEFPAGVASQLGLQCGDRLTLCGQHRR
jgi:uncharacterized membrane protein (UPF0127 family)